MNIENQKAKNIYNIAGDLHVQNSPEVIAILNKDKQVKLKELSSISFFDILQKEYSERTLIEREVEISQIKQKLNETQQLILFGDPGIGKTTSLFQLSREFENIVYISAKSKSPIAIISYLINKIRLSNNEELLEIKELEEAFEWFQVNLQKSKQFFIIDDCEQDEETIRKIISFEKFETTFLFVTRSKTPFESTGATFYPCSPFFENEVRLYLKEHGVTFNKLEFNNIFRMSCGNPLYLFYFSQFQLSPLPDGLVEYQNSIWSNLTEPQQEILAFVSIPYSNITISEVTEILNYKSILEFSNEIDKLSTLIKNNEGILELFHPSFKEFILKKLKSKGILQHYQEKLGDYYLTKDKIVEATYLLIDIAPVKIDKYLLDVFPSLINWGELVFALKVLNTKLNTVKKEFDKGYIYYHLCHVYHLLGDIENSGRCIDKSLKYFKKTKNKKFYAAALLFKAMTLIEQGQVNEAIQIADKVFLNINDKDKMLRAMFLVNLSKIYVDLSEFEKGANASKEAFETFEALEVPNGMMTSLVNLVSCLSQIDNYEDEAEKYALRLLEIIQNQSKYLMESGILNSLVSIYRGKNNFKKAKYYGNKAIKLCQKHEMKDKVVMSLINFGNILRDEKDLKNAKKIYNEALIYAEKYNLKKNKGRIYWLLAVIHNEEKHFDYALELIEKSLDICEQMNFYFDAARALEVKSQTLLLQNESSKAADSMVASARYFEKIKQFSGKFQYNISEAIKIYNKVGKKESSNQLINELIENNNNRMDYGEAINLILNESSKENKEANLKKIFEKYFTDENNNLNIITQFLSFMDYCIKLGENDGKQLFKTIINIIITKLGMVKFSYSILGIAVEQSGFLLDQDDLDTIFESLQGKLPIFNVRVINNDRIIITSIANKINLELHVDIDEIICNKLVIALILILHESPDIIMEETPFKETKCVIQIYRYSEEMEEILKKYHADAELFVEDCVQSLHMEKKDYMAPEIILINPDYEINSSFNIAPDNKVSLYFLVTAIIGIKNHFLHLNIKKSKKQRTLILNSIANLWDFTSITTEDKTKFEINVEKINSYLKNAILLLTIIRATSVNI